MFVNVVFTGNSFMIGTEQYTDKYIMERMEIMSKVAVVYWSGTANTAAMATAVAEGTQEKGRRLR